MLHWIISSSLRLRAIMAALAVLLLIWGGWRLSNTQLDVVPEFSPLSLEVQTEALGLSASEVESLITVPLEADLLNGVPWLQSIESESMTGLSAIELFFAPGTDLMKARQMVEERLTQAHALPNVSKPPVLMQPVSSASRIMNIGLSSKTVSLIEMSVQTRWNIVPRLLGVPGVANVSVWGQRDRQIQVQVNPAVLHSHGISLEQVIKTAGESVWASPLTYLTSSTPGAGGFIDTPNQRLGVRHISPTSTPASFARVPVFGTSLPLQKVARVVEDNQPLIGDAILNKGIGLMLVVEKFPGANTLEVTHGVEAALKELSPGMKGIEVDTTIYRPASYIDRATSNLTKGLLAAGVLMIAALWVLFGSWRAALVAAVVIPCSLLAAELVFHARGENIDMMIVAGLMLAVAVIIADAVADVDAIVRRLRQAREHGSTESAFTVVTRAALEVRGPLLFATSIIVLAVIPLLLMKGSLALFFRPVIWSYLVAVLVSTATALVLTPVLSFLLLAKAPLSGQGSLMEGLHGGLSRLLSAAMRMPLLSFLLAAAGVVVGVVTWTQSEHSLIPSFKETDVLVEWQAAPGTSLLAMRRSTEALLNDIRAIPGVRNVAAHVGRAVLTKDIADVDTAEVWVSIDPDADYNKTLAALRDTVGTYPGVAGEVNTFLSKKMRETLVGDEETIGVRVYGHDQTILGGKAEQIRELLTKIDGIESPHIEKPELKTTIEVEVDLNKAQRYALKPGDVRRAASALVAGITVGALFEDQKVFDVVVLGNPDVRKNLSDIRNLLIDTPAGNQVRLTEVADVRTIASPNIIRRQGVSRRLDITAQVNGRDVGAVSREVAQRIKEISFPFEYHAQVVGEHFEQKEAFGPLYRYFAAALLIGFLLLQVAIGSWRLAMLALLGLPIALLGGFLAVLLTGSTFTVGALLGFIPLFAISVRQGIALVRHFQALELQNVAFGPELVARGLREFFPAVVTSAITTGLFALPFAVLGNIAGLEIAHAIAIVLLGGLVTTTLLALFCIPALYLRYGASSAQDRSSMAAELAGN